MRKTKTKKTNYISYYYYGNITDYNISDFSEKESGIKTKISNIKNEKEKIFLNSFTNLLRIKENSFHINSLYENINEITRSKYSKDSTLQTKTKDFLVNQCTIIHNYSQKNNRLMLKNPVNGQFVVSKFSTLKNVKNVSDIKESKRSVNSDDLSELKSSINDNNNNNNDNIKKLRISKSRKSSDSGSIIEKSKHEDSNKVRRYDSYKMIQTLKEPKKSLNGSEYPSKYKCKSPKKKRDQEIFVNKKLN